MKKMDYVFGMSVIAISIFILFFSTFHVKKGVFAEISQDGEVIGIYSLLEDRSIRVDALDGGYNTICIKDQSVYVQHADCGNQLCVRQQPIKNVGETIICLPHKLCIRIIGEWEDKSKIDVITQ